MSMITIMNVSKGQPNQQTATTKTTSSDSGGAIPPYLAIAPGDSVKVPDQSFVDWLPGAKQKIAEYMVHGILKVFTMNSVHIYQDKNHNAVYDYDYLIDAKFGPLAQTHAFNMASTLNGMMNLHFASLAVHGGAVGNITATVPTTLATLITWISDAQTQHTAHLASVGVAPNAHPNADTVNTLAPVAAVNWPTCIQALQELHRTYHSHKEWTLATTELNANAVLAY